MIARCLLIGALVLAVNGILADDFKTIDGKEYKNTKVSRVEPDGIVLITKSGISKVYFTELPKEVQERFYYDAAKAAAYSGEQTANQEALYKQRQELERRRVEERERYWSEQTQIKSQREAEIQRQLRAAEQQRPAEIQRSTPSVSKEGMPEHTYELLQDYTIVIPGTTDLRRRLRRGERYHGRILIDHAEIDINGISYSVPSAILSAPVD